MKPVYAVKYLFAIFLFAVMGCEEINTNQTFTIGKESIFRINQLYSSTDGQYTFLITELSDSRCPEGVQCVWSGEVSLKGEWIDNNTKAPVELHSVLVDLQTVPDGFTMRIVDAIPYPKYDSESRPENLIITLLIQKK